MSYQKTNWENFPSIKTQINAENLNKMEEGIYEAHQSFDNIPEWAKQPEKPTYSAEEVGSLDESEILKLAITPTATGTQIVARDTAEWPIQSLTVYGRSEQVKTTGKNLLGGRYYHAEYSRNIPFIKNKEAIELPFAPTHETGGVCKVAKCQKGQTYTFSCTNANKNAACCMAEYDSIDSAMDTSKAIGGVYMTATRLEMSYTAKSDGILVCGIMGKWTDGSTTIHECTESESLQLELGSTATEYEPYTGGKPAPSPDYPQPIVSAGERLSTGVQLLDGNNLEIGGINGGTGELVDALNRIRIVGIGVTPGTLYTLSGYDVDYNLQSSHVFDADGSRIGGFTSGGAMLDGAAKLSLCFARKDWANMAETDLEYLRNHLVLNEGAAALPYEPYTGGVPAAYPVGIEVAISGKNFVPQNAEYRKKFSVSLKANDTVTCSAIVTSSSPIDYPGGIRFYFADGTGEGFYFTSKSNNRSSLTTTLKKDVVNAMFDYGECCDFQIELGSSATAYEPYRGRQTITLASNGLPGIQVSSDKSYADTIEYRGGQAVYVKRVWSKTFTGGAGEYWSLYNSANYEGFASNCLPENYRRAPGFCNLLTVHAGAVHQGEDGLWIGADNKLVYNHNSRFYDTTLEDKGLANWKAYLAAHPMTVMTYLTTPVETPLTDAEAAQLAALHTYKPTTTITNDAGAGMEVGYVADTKAYIDNKFAELQAAQAITNAQLI